jgi:hypothetical protein
MQLTMIAVYKNSCFVILLSLVWDQGGTFYDKKTSDEVDFAEQKKEDCFSTKVFVVEDWERKVRPKMSSKISINKNKGRKKLAFGTKLKVWYQNAKYVSPYFFWTFC